MSKLTEFYDESGVDSEGRKLSDIWAEGDDFLEFAHNWVQWLFPLAEPSNFNPDAPIPTEEDIQIFRANPLIQTNLLVSFARYLRFFGLEYVDGEVRATPEFELIVFQIANHNWFRITRVLKSLRLLGLEKEAVAFYKFLHWLHTTCGMVSDNSFSFWKEAVNGLVEMQ